MIHDSPVMGVSDGTLSCKLAVHFGTEEALEESWE